MKIRIPHVLATTLLLFSAVSCKDEDTGKPTLVPPGVGPTKSTGDPHQGEAPLPAENGVPPTGNDIHSGTGSGTGPSGDQPARSLEQAPK